jgi:hypothetical protein
MDRPRARQDTLLSFYTELLGAVEVRRVPEAGPTFYIGLRVGDSDLGLVAEAEVDTGTVPRR